MPQRRRPGEVWVGKIDQHGDKWRFRMGRGSQTTSRPSYSTEADAKKARAAVLRQIAAQAQEEVTMASALAGYREYYSTERGAKPRTVEVELSRVVRFFGRDDGPLPYLTPDSGKALYADLRKRPCRTGRPVSDAEHQGCLKAARRFGAWLVREKHWRTNPLKEVALVGRPKRGEESKRQLSIDQGRMWLDGALAAFEMGDQSALAAAVCLVMGCRVSEVASRRVSHLDVDASLLRITQSKTAKGRRGLPVPYPTQDNPDRPDLRTALRNQAARARAWGRAQPVTQLDPPLFPPVPFATGGRPIMGEHLSRHSIRRTVHRICRSVGVPLVCPHALRGTFGSVAVQSGEVIGRVADVLGQAGELVLRRHYATEEAQAAGAAAQRLQVMSGTATVTAQALPTAAQSTNTQQHPPSVRERYDPASDAP